MHTYRRRCGVALVAMAVVAPLVLYFQFDVPAEADLDSLQDIPTELGPWHMVDERGPTEKEREILETDAILTRTYSRGQPPQCDLSVVFARDNRRVAHPPEICYKGSGWLVEQRQVETFDVDGEPFRANRLLLLHGTSRLIVLYWYKAGEVCTDNYLKMQGHIILSHLTRRGSSSALCRVSAMSPAPDRDGAVLATLRGFARRAIPAVNAAVR
ncbi:MAG: exosortase C-terminal domain/associated protein EpsI [bacterium]